MFILVDPCFRKFWENAKGEALMKNSLDYPELLSQLHQDNSNSLDLLADRIGEMLECPITIEDSTHQIISYSRHKENVDEARIATIISRKVPDKIINSLWKNGIMAKLFESDEPVIVPAIEEVGLGNRVAVSIRKHNEVLGFIWAQINDKTMGDDQMRLLKEAAKFVKNHLLLQRMRKRKEEESHQEFLWQLLTGHLNDVSKIKRQAKRAGVNLDGRLAVAIIEFDDDISQAIEKHAYYLAETLQHVQVVGRLFDQNQLILLTRLRTEQEARSALSSFIKDFIHKISMRLQIRKITGSFGSVYNSPEHVQYSYKQALKVLRLKEKFPDELQQTYSFQEIGTYQFLDELYQIRVRDHYQSEAITKLREYDLKHRTDLLLTLKTYLECDSNVYQASQLLHIHPNTLNYRLKRVVELTEVNLKDPNQKIILYLDLKLESMKVE